MFHLDPEITLLPAILSGIEGRAAQYLLQVLLRAALKYTAMLKPEPPIICGLKGFGMSFDGIDNLFSEVKNTKEVECNNEFVDTEITSDRLLNTGGAASFSSLCPFSMYL